MIIEACVETVDQAVAAEAAGANRIELCASLDEGGLSPMLKTVEEYKVRCTLPLKVMLRTRPGDFVYSEDDIVDLKEQVFELYTLYIDELVFGALTKNNEVDMDVMQEIATSTSDLKITFHKAIDLCADPLAELERLASIPQVTSILTSGKAETALEGAALINDMHSMYGDRFEIVAAGKITNENLEQVKSKIFTPAYHGRRIVG